MADKPGKLYIVSTPIGDPKDITLRALEVLNQADGVICEEFRTATTLFKQHGISKKPLIIYNEHNAGDETAGIIEKLLLGSNLALISDCGTPVFADPGHLLIQEATAFQIEVVAVPGASSLMATLSLLPIDLTEFYFAGFLPRETTARNRRLNDLRNIKAPIVLMDTPYRLRKLVDECMSAFGKNQTAMLACDLTLPTELVVRGTLSEIKQAIGNRKAEFLLVLFRWDTSTRSYTRSSVR